MGHRGWTARSGTTVFIEILISQFRHCFNQNVTIVIVFLGKNFITTPRIEAWRPYKAGIESLGRLGERGLNSAGTQP
jgi:hypothetical protein